MSRAQGKVQGKRFGKQRISFRQVKIIHTITGKLGLDDDTYRAILAQYPGPEGEPAATCKDLTWQQAEQLIDELNRKAGNPPQSPLKLRGEAEGRGVMRYADLDGRPGMCNGKQARMVAGMWAEVSRAETEEDREKALWRFLRRICGVDHFRFLKSWQVEKVVKAIKEMQKAQGK
jgi:hypothetical protein